MKTYWASLLSFGMSLMAVNVQAEVPAWLKNGTDQSRYVGTANKSLDHPVYEGEVAVGLVWRMSRIDLPDGQQAIGLRSMSLDDVLSPKDKLHVMYIRMSQERIELFFMTDNVISQQGSIPCTLFLDGRPETDKWVLSDDKTGLFYQGDVLQLISRLEVCNKAISVAFTGDESLTEMHYFSVYGLKEAMGAALQELSKQTAPR